MRRIDERWIFSPSDLTAFTGCEHQTEQEIAVALGQRKRPAFASEYGELLRHKGQAHEQRFLESLRDAGHAVTEVGRGDTPDFEAAVSATRSAIRDGAEYVYQAAFLERGWRGVADFLERVERPSELGAWSYRVLDTKLARHPRPEHVLQLCFYSHALSRIQGVLPEVARIVLGTSEAIEVRLSEVSAYYRRLVRRFESAVAQGARFAPYPCEACPFCDFRSTCGERWRKEDHLSQVAGIRRDQVGRLLDQGIRSLSSLAQAPAATRVPKMREQTLCGLREQAELQLEAQRSGRVGWRLQRLEAGRGFSLLPRHSPGDVILDLEGHPFHEPGRGLEFLFGILTLEAEGPRYRPVWGHGREGERRAFEELVDFVHARLALYPDFHVYHYGAHETGTLKRLMGEHATREVEIDDLLRRGVFVDLLTVVRQALRAGVTSYSLKEIEKLYGFERGAEVGSGTQAVLAYERWLEQGDGALLDAIARYNEEDCRATLGLLRWLHALRPQDLAWREAAAVRPVSEEQTQAQDARQRLRAELIEGAPPGTLRALAGEILEYHRREARPAWWHFFARLGMSPEELLEDAESIGDLGEDPGTPPAALKKSLVHTLTFPPQDHKLKPGSVTDPATGKSAGEIVAIDDAAGTLLLKRGPKLRDAPLPRAIVDSGPYDDRAQKAAVLRAAESIRAEDGRYPALSSLLAREVPRCAGHARGAKVHTTELEEMKRLALALDGSHLFLQGPPGTGKTWNGARLVAHLIRNGKRVGVTAQSHKAIHNLLAKVEEASAAEGFEFRGLKKSSQDNPESEYAGRFVQSEADSSKVIAALPEVELVAGTSFFFSQPGLDRKLDHLVIDEAGQVALADAVAMGVAAQNVILLGDPLQLAQVSQGIHPAGSGASVLEHLLGEAPTIPEDRGIFLERSFRMHPDVCGFISEIVYAGRLHADEAAARRSTSFGTGIRFLPVPHEGNRSASEEEVERIAREIERMLGGSFRDEHGGTRPLREGDFMVVAPYNAQVRRLRAALPRAVGVGTVDKFQGQQTPVVFYSMATSSGDDVPRNRSFLFSRNRLNVAISRAQCLAFLVCSPRLLDARCATLEEMQLVNALCRLVEYAEAQT